MMGLQDIRVKISIPLFYFLPVNTLSSSFTPIVAQLVAFSLPHPAPVDIQSSSNAQLLVILKTGGV